MAEGPGDGYRGRTSISDICLRPNTWRNVKGLFRDRTRARLERPAGQPRGISERQGTARKDRRGEGYHLALRTVPDAHLERQAGQPRGVVSGKERCGKRRSGRENLRKWVKGHSPRDF